MRDAGLRAGPQVVQPGSLALRDVGSRRRRQRRPEQRSPHGAHDAGTDRRSAEDGAGVGAEAGAVTPPSPRLRRASCFATNVDANPAKRVARSSMAGGDGQQEIYLIKILSGKWGQFRTRELLGFPEESP